MRFLFVALIFSFGPPLALGDDFLPSHFYVDLVQEYESALPGGETRTSEGSIAYRYPGNIRFEISSPDQIVFVSDGKKTWYYTAPAMEGEPGELNISEASNSGLSRFFDSLKNGLKSNETYVVEKGEKKATLKFSEKMARELDIKQAVLKFKSEDFSFSNIQAVDLTYLDDHETQLIFKKMDLSPQFEKKTFKFERPENTRVNQI